MTEPNSPTAETNAKAEAMAKPASRAQSKRSVMQIARFVIGSLIMLAILKYVDLGQFFATLQSLNPLLVVAMLVVAMLGRFIRAWKWNSLLRARGIRISNWQAIRLSLVSHFTGAWTPGQIGGDAYRILALRSYGKSDVVLSTVLIERYAGLCAVSLFSLVMLPITLPVLYRHSPWLLGTILLAIGAVAGVIPCLFSKRVWRFAASVVPGFRSSSAAAKMRSFYETLLEYQNHKAILVVFGLATLMEVLSYFVLNYLSARALGLDVKLVFFLFAMPIVHLLLRIPLSVQALGVQEGCFVYALLIHGFTAAEGLAVSVVQRTLEYVVSIVPGGLLLWLTSGPSPYDSSTDADE